MQDDREPVPDSNDEAAEKRARVLLIGGERAEGLGERPVAGALETAEDAAPEPTPEAIPPPEAEEAPLAPPPDLEKEARLRAVFDQIAALGERNPFAADFGEYEARLDTGRQAVAQIEREGGNAKQNEAIAGVAAALALGTGAPETAPGFFLGVAGRVAETVVWYADLVKTGEHWRCAPALVPYARGGIPFEDAERFFRLRVPPIHAIKMYRYIYPSRVAPVLPLPSAAPASARLRPMPVKPKRKKSGGERKRRS